MAAVATEAGLPERILTEYRGRTDVFDQPEQRRLVEALASGRGPLETASGWIEEQRKVWESRLDRLEGCLHNLQNENGTNDDNE